MKKNRIYTFINLVAVVLTIVLAGSAFAGGSVGKTSPPQSSNYETIEGVLSIKEGHGDFLVRLWGEEPGSDHGERLKIKDVC